jgi:hypothetical protein
MDELPAVAVGAAVEVSVDMGMRLILRALLNSAD